MGDQHAAALHPAKSTSRKSTQASAELVDGPDDSLQGWIERYLAFAVTGVRSPAVADKIHLHLGRYLDYFRQSYGHDRASACVRRDVQTWQQRLVESGLAAATVNNHLASLSAFTTWVHAHDASVFPVGDPAKGVGDLGLPPLEPRALSDEQVRSLKNLCDRLHRFCQVRGRQHTGSIAARLRAQSRPYRDRAIVFLLLSTGLRREELTGLDTDQVEPRSPEELRRGRKARIANVRGKGRTERVVFLSQDARLALADYLEMERPMDAGDAANALFLSASCVAARGSDGRLSVRAVNGILERIGRLHDAETRDASRSISPLRPHDLRHTFAFQLAKATGADAYELERRLGHRSQRYIQRYTNPPEDVAASYVEEF